MGKEQISDVRLSKLGYVPSKEICLRCLYHVQMYNPQAKCWRKPDSIMCDRCRDVSHKCVKIVGKKARKKLKEFQITRKRLKDTVDISHKAELKAQVQNMALAVRKAHSRNQSESKIRKSHEELLLDGLGKIEQHLRILSKCMLKIATIDKKDIASSDDSESDEVESDNAEDEVHNSVLE